MNFLYNTDMKKQIIYILSLVLLVFSFLFIESCKKDNFDEPPLYKKFELPSGATLVSIKSLKNAHDSAVTASHFDTIKENVYIAGTLISNDSCGNVYKYLAIQDTSGGIFINIENSELYKKYRLGQKLYIRCKGLIMGNQIQSSSGASHSVMPQLGFRSGMEITSIPDVIKTDYIFKDSLPGAGITPKSFSAFNQISSKYLGTLIKVTNVHFASAGAIFNIGTSYPVTDLLDSTGTIIGAYATQYCCFAKDTIPAGKGTVTGILSIYDGTYQFVIRNINDVGEFAQ